MKMGTNPAVEQLLIESGVQTVELAPGDWPDYRVAMTAANVRAEQEVGPAMLLAWYDRDRDFESPQHTSECHLDSAIPGYVDYAVSRGARLRVTVDRGRFVFLYLPTKI